MKRKFISLSEVLYFYLFYKVEVEILSKSFFGHFSFVFVARGCFSGNKVDLAIPVLPRFPCPVPSHVPTQKNMKETKLLHT
jgi:hypothetical protein